MTVGTQATEAQVNATLTNLAVAMRELAADVLQQQAYYNKLGLAGLEVLGFTAQDAQAVLDDINHLGTVAQVYKGTATQGTAFSFEDYLCPLWAGQ